MCNAWNHPPGCTCGWGGDGHLGVSPGGFGAPGVPNIYGVEPGQYRWAQAGETPHSPTDCPKCGDAVYFVRHNGGSVWLDELGYPWPKHGCFEPDLYGVRLFSILGESARESVEFGTIVEATILPDADSMEFVVSCMDGSKVTARLRPPRPPSTVLGRLALIRRRGVTPISVTIIQPAQRKLYAFHQIVTGIPERVVEEFLYREKAEAEARLAELNSRWPPRYRLRTAKRYEYR